MGRPTLRVYMVGQCLSLDVHVYVDVDDVHDDYDVHVFCLT